MRVYVIIAAASLLFGCGDYDQSWYDQHQRTPDPNCQPPCSESDSMSGWYNQ